MEKNTDLEEIYGHYFQTYYTKLWRLAQRILARHTGRSDPDRAAEAVQEACRETTKGTPTMAYLDGILLSDLVLPESAGDNYVI